MGLDDNEGKAIREAKELLKSDLLPGRLAYIKVNFSCLPGAITKLEGRLKLMESIKVIEDVTEKITAQPVAEKLRKVLDKNPGYKRVCQIASVLNGTSNDMGGMEPDVLAKFANAPLTSVDCERVFSSFKDLFAPKRPFTETHLRDHLIVQWNDSLF